MRLLIVRHGETDANCRQVLQGHLDNPLNENGKAQARMLGQRLSDEAIDALLCSDLRRARETAEIIAAETGSTPELCTLLRERCYGEFEGLPVADYKNALTASCLSREEFVPQGGESLFDVEERVRAFLTTTLTERKAGTLLLVAHSGTNKALLKVLLRQPSAEWTSIEQDNACLNIIELSEDPPKAVVLNCTLHLQSTDAASVIEI
jgi:broad specificity phosphatase PhoE